MDNVTHALAGLLLAESATQLRRVRARAMPSATFRRVAAVAGVVAAELPDADLLYAGPALGLGKLGYLLHHRGHTHTVVVALFGALLTWAVTLAWWRWVRASDRIPATRDDQRWLLALCAAGTLSHLLLDFTNSYGVHPFWPLANEWHYGDAVFIVEPWLWIAAIPPLLLATRGTIGRAILGLLLGGVLAAAWWVGMVSWGTALALTLGAAIAVVVALSLAARPGQRIALGVAGWLLVETVFFGASRSARDEVGRAARAVGAAPLADVVLTPAVSNPLCYDAIVVEADAATYRVTRATVAPFPSLRTASGCAGRASAGAGAVVMRPSPRAASEAVVWQQEWSAPRTELSALGTTNCVTAAALRFMRVPVWRRDASTITLGDLRFDRGAGGFAEIVAPIAPATCPAHVPPWRPPRADLVSLSP